MLSLNLHLRNPWSTENFKNLFNWTKLLTKHKALEIELTRYSYDAFELYLNTNFAGCDHAGPCLKIAILGYAGSIKLYDTRHWDYENKRWENYPEPVEKT